MNDWEVGDNIAKIERKSFNTKLFSRKEFEGNGDYDYWNYCHHQQDLQAAPVFPHSLYKIIMFGLEFHRLDS